MVRRVARLAGAFLAGASSVAALASVVAAVVAFADAERKMVLEFAPLKIIG